MASSSSNSAANTKENCDLAFEINITTGPNVQVRFIIWGIMRNFSQNTICISCPKQQVQVEVEEHDIDIDGNIIRKDGDEHHNDEEDVVPAIRDSSRNRLQRLGALYSDTENLSSPINRNESRFQIDDDSSAETTATESGGGAAKNRTRTGKLAALANSIKTWEDDLSHADCKRSKVPSSPTTPRVVAAKTNGTTTATTTKGSMNEPKNAPPPSKSLKWDQKVMDSLEQQGFTRRESTTSKMVYDYKETTAAGNASATKESVPSKQSAETNVTRNVAANNVPKEKVERKILNRPSMAAAVKKGTVSGRAAIFENCGTKSTATVGSSCATRSTHKDPAEMSLKDRLALFEKNKGTALIPKAAFGMSASHKQIVDQPPALVAQSIRRDAAVPAAAVQKLSTTVSGPAAVESAPKIDAYNKPGKIVFF